MLRLKSWRLGNMNYNSVQEILEADVTNMTVVHNYTMTNYYTTVKGVDWFEFDGVLANQITVSANSFLGFGSTEA